MRQFLLRCAIYAFALVLAELPVAGLGAPAISRADDDCARLVLERRLESVCVLASGGKWTRGSGWTRGTGRAGWARRTRPALDASRGLAAEVFASAARLLRVVILSKYRFRPTLE